MEAERWPTTEGKIWSPEATPLYSREASPAPPQTHTSSSPGQGSHAGWRDPAALPGASGPSGQLASLPFLVYLSNPIPTGLPLKSATGRKAASGGVSAALLAFLTVNHLTGTLLHCPHRPANCTGPGRWLCSPGMTVCLSPEPPSHGPPAEGCLTGCRLSRGHALGFASSLLQIFSRDTMAVSAHLRPRMTQSNHVSSGRPSTGDSLNLAIDLSL